MHLPSSAKPALCLRSPKNALRVFWPVWLLILKLSSLVAQNSCGAAGIAPGPRRLLGSLLEAAGEGARGSRGGTAGDVTAQRRSRKKGRSQIPIVTATRIRVLL